MKRITQFSILTLFLFFLSSCFKDEAVYCLEGKPQLEWEAPTNNLQIPYYEYVNVKGKACMERMGDSDKTGVFLTVLNQQTNEKLIEIQLIQEGTEESFYYGFRNIYSPSDTTQLLLRIWGQDSKGKNLTAEERTIICLPQ